MNIRYPEVGNVGLKPLASRGLEARFLVRLRVLNPNASPLNIDGTHYQVFLREQKTLSGVSAEALSITAYGEGLVELETVGGPLGSLALLRDMMADPPKRGLPYRLQAKLSVTRTLRALRIERDGLLQLNR